MKRRIFDSHARTGLLRLHEENFDEVAYASTRMLHAWGIPASVEGKPFVDASYTCLCPAVEVAEFGYTEVIAVATEPGPLWSDLFRRQRIPRRLGSTSIHVIGPEQEPRDLGVDFADATENGLRALYRHGEEQGRAFLAAQG